MSIAFIEIAVDGGLGLVDAAIVAVVDDGPSHAAEDGFDDVQELRPRRQKGRLDERPAGLRRSLVVLLDPLEELLRNVP